MSSITIKDKRDVIPNWHEYIKTARLGELYAMGSDKMSLPLYPITEYIESWESERSLPFAGDLISAAVLNGQKELPEVKEAATFIINEETANSLLKEIANSIISNNEIQTLGFETVPNDLLSSIEAGSVGNKSLIHFIKEENKKFPYNPIAYCELARCYVSLGLYRKAIESMEIALHLAPYSRYVSRCAGRLFVHLKEYDRAHHVVAINPALKCDPWLLASEIAINTSMGRNSKYVNIGKRIILSNNFSSFSCSELSSAIGTLEMMHGSRKRCIEYVNSSLICPNDNSLAQAEWLSGENKDLHFTFGDYSNMSSKAEAEARYSYFKQNYELSFLNSLRWLEDYPYDMSAILFSSHVAYSFLKDYDSAIRILKLGLIANPNNSILLNNIAYVYALNGYIKEASTIVDNPMFISSFNTSEDLICHMATRGLVEYRRNNPIQGRDLYINAIDKAKEISTDKTLIIKAILNFIREEIISHSCTAEDAESILDKLGIGNNQEIIQLRQDIYTELGIHSLYLPKNDSTSHLGDRLVNL